MNLRGDLFRQVAQLSTKRIPSTGGGKFTNLRTVKAKNDTHLNWVGFYGGGNQSGPIGHGVMSVVKEPQKIAEEKARCTECFQRTTHPKKRRECLAPSFGQYAWAGRT